MANKVLNNSLVFRLIKKKNSLVFSLKDGTTVQRCALMRTVDNAREWNIGENLVGWLKKHKQDPYQQIIAPTCSF